MSKNTLLKEMINSAEDKVNTDKEESIATAEDTGPKETAGSGNPPGVPTNPA